LPDVVWHSFDFLIEMMINYGLALQERQSLLKQQEELKVEMDLAANVQETLLKTKLPLLEGLDIGLLSIPARKMNGDYIYFVSDHDGYAGVAVADVIGKGLPAALCMSMIKFGMDSLSSTHALPKDVLSVIMSSASYLQKDCCWVYLRPQSMNNIVSIWKKAIW